MGDLTRFGQVVRTVLYIQAVFALIAGTAYLLHLPFGASGQGGMDARRLGLVYYGFAVLLFFAGRNLAQDPRWLFPVIAFVGFSLVDSSYEFLVRGDASFLPPLVVEIIFLALYVAGALVLGRLRVPAGPEPR